MSAHVLFIHLQRVLPDGGMQRCKKQKSNIFQMKIIFIGAGNLATNLAKALVAAGHDVLQVYSRTMESAQRLAMTAGGAPVCSLDAVSGDADVYIIAVKDSVLPEIIPQVCSGKGEKVFCHTAGSMPMSLFEGQALHYGVLYPMQTFSKERDVNFREIPCFIESSDSVADSVLRQLAGSVSDRVMPLSTDNRRYLHLAAVFASNFVNHCYGIAGDLIGKCGLPFDVLLPLIDETARKVHELPPVKAQTGPAVRYDENVIRAQSSMLRGNPIVKDLYDRMSMSIHARQMKEEGKK